MKQIKTLILNIMERAGFVRVKSLPPNPLCRCFGALQKLGFQPRHIVDVGAHEGGWTLRAMQYFPNAFYSLLEPQPKYADALASRFADSASVKVFNVGAADKESELLLTLHERSDSSTFSMSTSKAQELGRKQIPIKVVTLDGLFSEADIHPDCVKIDAEGFDMKVLFGAKSVLANSDIVFVEVAICRKGENKLPNILSFLDENGFAIFDITDIYYNPNTTQLSFIEACFVKKNCPTFSHVVIP